jgi:hypothetical protein
VAIGFTINVRSKPAIEIAPTLASRGPGPTGKFEPAIEIPPTLASRPPARTGKFEFQPVEAGFVYVDAVSTALSMSVDICLCQRS